MPHDPGSLPEYVTVEIRIPTRGTPEQYEQALGKLAAEMIYGRAGAAAGALLKLQSYIRVAALMAESLRQPGGFAFVPRRPTQAMKEAGSRAWLNGSREDDHKASPLRYVRSVERVWQAMLAEAANAGSPAPDAATDGKAP